MFLKQIVFFACKALDPTGSVRFDCLLYAISSLLLYVYTPMIC